MGTGRNAGLCGSTLRAPQSPERRHRPLWASKPCAVSVGSSVPCLPELSAGAEPCGCRNPQQTPGLRCCASLRGQEGCARTNPFIWTASCSGTNKKGLIRQTRCCEALLGIQDVWAVAEKCFSSVSYICLRFSLQHLLLKICMVVELGRIKSTYKILSPHST